MLARIIHSIEEQLDKEGGKNRPLSYCLNLFRALQKSIKWCSKQEYKRRLKVGKLFDVPIIIAPSFLLLCFLFVSVWGISGLIIATISLFVHEFAHVLHARNFDVSTKNVLVHAGGAAANMELNEKNHFLIQPQAEWEVGAVGPLASLALSALGYTVATGFLIAGIDPSVPAACGVINLAFGLFNLIPIIPLDGGRVLEGFLHQHVFKTTEQRLSFMDERERLNDHLRIMAFTPIIIAPLAIPILLYTFKLRAKELETTKVFLRWQLRQEKIKARNDFKLLEHHVYTKWWMDLGLFEMPSSTMELKRAYRKATLTAHPDQGGSTSALLRVRKAYEIGKSKLEGLGFQ